MGDGAYLCPPVSPDWGDECDPYHDDCGTDDCIESSGSPDASGLEGCTGDGGGDIGDDGGGVGNPGGGGGDDGGSGGGRDGGVKCPDYGCEEPPPPAEDDFLGPGTAPPDCTNPVLLDWEHAWCTSTPPSGERLTRTQNSLQRVAARGGECANIATFGQQLLSTGMIRYFAHVQEIHGEYVGWGAADFGVLLAEQWIDHFGGTLTGYPNLDRKLVHEIEHAMGRDHIDAYGYETPNSAVCAGF